MVVRGARFAAPEAPFGIDGEATARPWLGRPLGEQQEAALFDAGVRPVASAAEALEGGSEAVLVREDAAVRSEAVAALLERGRAAGVDAAFVPSGRSGGLLEELRLGDEGPLLVYLRPGAWDPSRLNDATPLEVDSKERLLEVPVPRSQFGADFVQIPISDRLVLPTSHWLQLLWANMLGLPPFLWRTLAGRNIAEVAWRVGWTALRRVSVDPRTIGGALGRKGRRCRIHPSAVVEGCWLGDDVQIGANAVVRGSVLAAGATVEDLAVVEACVLAPGARVQRLGMVKYSVLGERAAHAGMMQLGVLDRDAAVKGGALLMDMAPGQEVRVATASGLRAAPLGLAGVCVGAETVIGAGVGVAPGRRVPAGLEVVADPSRLVRRIPDGLTGRVTARNGTLEPVR